ncbi:hypothetical protein CDO52_04110 [Nocardiopsis gilva YIM 90087]|uniref:Uncharacterized protein n=1 Tax=Nocardiopsis gilva YIM 90087 TaxID=1235441 RepID=A0A223S1Q1_9ACTN|nr:hypothetical protein [Nocardiopsis gilva]ASU82073.1 hypothetical protein CDO52_04110 [Nocardiopsis gilva YIM 90087]
MDSDIDMRLHDHVALAEIELYAEVLSAVATAEAPLSLDEIDRVLGVRPDVLDQEPSAVLPPASSVTSSPCAAPRPRRSHQTTGPETCRG